VRQFHDAILIEAPLGKLDESVIRAQTAMSDASSAVLNGFKLRTEVKIVRFPDRYMDERGVKMWDTMQSILHENLFQLDTN
jgi:hypothetical protein